MTQLTLNNLDPYILEKLKTRAMSHQRSLEDELKAILQEVIETEQAVQVQAFSEQAAQMRQALYGRSHTDSADLIRQDRER